MQIPPCYDPNENPLCAGGFSDVWKAEHNDRAVAAKTLGVCLTSDVEKIRKVGGFRPIMVTDELTGLYAAILQGSYYMEKASPPKRVTVDRCDDGGKTVRGGVGVDEQWEHCPIP